MFPREPPGGSGVSLQSLPADILKSCLWPLLSPEDTKCVRILNKHMRQQADACVTSQTITIPAEPSHLPSLQEQLTKFPRVLILYPGSLVLHWCNGLASTNCVTIILFGGQNLWKLGESLSPHCQAYYA